MIPKKLAEKRDEYNKQARVEDEDALEEFSLNGVVHGDIADWTERARLAGFNACYEEMRPLVEAVENVYHSLGRDSKTGEEVCLKLCDRCALNKALKALKTIGM